MLTDRQFLESVLDALDFLIEHWDQEVDDKSLRLTSPVLRRLIVYGDLSKAWREIGFKKEPIIITTDLNNILNDAPIRRVDFASAGGANYKGAEIAGMVMLDMARTPKQEKNEPPFKSFGFTAFSRSSCLLLTRRSKFGMEQEFITRNELISFFAKSVRSFRL